MTPALFWLLLLSAACAFHLAYWGALHAGFARAQRGTPMPRADLPADLPPVSVVVAARDEAAALPALLTALTQQTHPRFDLVIVDDASVDATAALVRAWHRTHPALRLVQVDDPQPPRKKHALTCGIAAARYDLLALTDADCAPPPDWLATLAQVHAATDGRALLVGYSPFQRAPGLLNRMARYETFVTGFLTAAAIGWGRAYMAVGRNLSYPRPLFDQLGGFAHSLPSMSGDDDLLVQEVVRRRAAPVHALLDARTFVPSDAPATWAEWIRQKRRHLSAGRFYGRPVQVHLTLFHATGVLLWAAPLLLGWAGGALLAAKLIGQGLVLRRAAAVLHARDLMPAQPMLDLLHAVYHLVLAPLGLARLPKRW